MGNAALRDIASIDEVQIDSVEGQSCAVDAYNWLYKYVTTTVQFTDSSEYRTSDGVEVPNLHGGIKGIRRFFENDITPIFVFDGGAHELKSDELEERREKRKTAQQEAEKAKESGDAVAAARQDARSKRLTEPMIQSTVELLDALDIQYIFAPSSGESQAAEMVSNGEWEFVISDDYDSMLFGASRTVRNFTSTSRPLELLELEHTLNEADLTREQLVDIALLCGTDYNDGVRGYGPKTSVDSVRSQGDIFEVLESSGNEIEHVTEIRNIFLSPNVTSEYPSPVEPSPDLGDAENVLVSRWDIPEDVVSPALDKIEAVSSQSGLGEWT
jgi:flap endonuclease-1